MHIVLPGALPNTEIAGELADAVDRQAPTLARWLRYGSARVQACPSAETWCTAHEHWQLTARGFTPATGEHLSAGLGPLRSTATPDDEPVWLAELVNLSPSRDGAVLLPAEALGIDSADAKTLFADACTHAEDEGIRLEWETDTRWRVHWPTPRTIACASPALVAVSSVNDWWPTDDAARPWRRLVNTLQMAWYTHPVNQKREAAGAAPINSLWLYGGARASQLTRALPEDVHTHTALLQAATRQDWGRWIEALDTLEAEVFQPHARAAPTLVLTGQDRHVTVPVGAHWWNRLHARNWRQWWCNP